jgi:hypothetical protein
MTIKRESGIAFFIAEGQQSGNCSKSGKELAGEKLIEGAIVLES